jgi:hypothetical protein
VVYADGLAAIQAYPGFNDTLDHELRRILGPALIA